MVAHCCICNSHSGQQEDVTFHKLPRNENRANAWTRIISGIGIDISRTATVCSQHFDESQFRYKVVGSDIKRFLTSNAIPNKNVTAPTCPTQSSGNSDHEPAQMEKDDTKDLIVQESVLINSDHEPAQMEKDDTKDVIVQESVRINLVNDEIKNEHSTLSKRKDDSADNTNRKRARVKTVRYIGDIGREDFVSNDAYQVVQSYVRNSKNEIKSLKQKVRRMNTKIHTMKDLTDNLRSNNMLTSQAAKFLQVSTLSSK